MTDDFIVGKQRRRIEDSIVARFEQVDFKQNLHAYLEQEHFWDYVFSWYELVRYYEESGDNTLGAHMVELYQQCDAFFRIAASDKRLTERRRDKAADALYQLTYYVNQIAVQIRRNVLERESEHGNITWKNPPDDMTNFN
jgi:hypothetical protein